MKVKLDKIKILINKLINFIYFGNYFRNPFYREFGFLNDYIPRNAKILEAGAHTGSDTIRMYYAFKNSTIYAFEPEPSAYKKLCKKAYGYSNIHTYNIALGEKEEKKKLFVSENRLDASSSLLPQSETHRKFHPTINLNHSLEVNVTTIDSWIKENNVNSIDFMWLDMQGNELTALKSSKNILHKVKAIYTEVLLSPTYQNAPLYEEFKLWMEKEGFVVKLEKDVSEEQSNVLFIRK